MARARICVDYNDKIVSVHCENNTQLTRTGKILLNYYTNDFNKIEELLTIGAFRQMHPEIQQIQRERYSDYVPNNYAKLEDFCIEDFIKHLTNTRANLYVEQQGSYIYMWRNERWFYLHNSTHLMFVPLTKEIIQSEIEKGN